MTEVIKEIKGFEGRYTISNKGIVRSLLTGKIMKQGITRFGYARINLRYPNSRKFKSFLVHRLVAGNFLPNPNNYKEVNHIDCNRLNNNLDNLEWCDRSYNQKHSFKYGIHSNKGNKNPNAKLDNNKILHIKELINEGKSHMSIAKIYNVSSSTIDMIANNKTWSNN